MTDELLQDPYREVPNTGKSRLNADIATEDKLFIQSVCPHRGVLQAMVNQFVKAVVDECRLRGITSYARLAEFNQVVRGRTYSYTVGESAGRDGRRGTESLRKRSSKPKNGKSKTKRKAKVGVEAREEETQGGSEG